MKRRLFSVGGLSLIAGLLFISCSKEENVPPEVKEPSVPVAEETLRIDPRTTHLTAEDAAQVSQLFMRREGPSPATRAAFGTKTVENTFPIRTAAGDVAAWAVNYAGGGFGIVSATKKFAPVLAFSETGRLTPEALQGNGIALWTEATAAEIARAEETLSEDSPEYADLRTQWSRYEYSEPIPALAAENYPQDAYYWYMQLRNEIMNNGWVCRNDVGGFKFTASLYGVGIGYNLEEEIAEKDRVLQINYAGANVPPAFIWGEGSTGTTATKIMPIVRTYWDQLYPYNKYNVPADAPEDQKYLAGCVTIAVSQIMNYHRHPATVSGTPIDWTKTQEMFASTDNDEIPKLIRLVNVGVKTQNGPTGSSSNIDNAKAFLQKNSYTVTKYTTKSDLASIIETEIRAKRPVYIRGMEKGASAGHAWVCDGFYSSTSHYAIDSYTITQTQKQNFTSNPYAREFSKSRSLQNTSFYHMNWGWGKGYMDESDPSTLRQNTIGWFRSVSDVDYNSSMQILKVVPKK